MKYSLKLLVCTLMVVSFYFGITAVATAHSGRTDANGGHNCNTGPCAGTYHYHNGGGSTPAPAPTPTPAPKPSPRPAPTPKPTPAPPPAPVVKPKSIERLRTLRNSNLSDVLWADLLLSEVKNVKTAATYSTIDATSEAAKRLTQSTQADKKVGNDTLYFVKSIVDGDTIKVVKEGKTETVRLLGIDTPETKDPRKPIQCFGKEATNHITALALGKYVRLSSDPSQGDRDKYQRLLRYVYLENGTNVNAEMVKSGYAAAYVRYPVSQIEELKRLQDSARQNNLGLWSACR